MELRHLRYFVSLAEDLSFTRAAQRLHIVQPALSQQIRELEDELGGELFHRNKRMVELSAAGRAFLPQARRILEDAENAAAQARRVLKGEAGRTRTGDSAAGTRCEAFGRLMLR